MKHLIGTLNRYNHIDWASRRTWHSECMTLKKFKLHSLRFVPGPRTIANLYMDFQKSTDINMDIHDFWMSVFNYPCKCGYPHWYQRTDILARTFRNGYPKTINIHKWISIFYGYQSSIFHAIIHASMYIHLDIHRSLWISMHWLSSIQGCLTIRQWEGRGTRYLKACASLLLSDQRPKRRVNNRLISKPVKRHLNLNYAVVCRRCS